MESLDKTPFGVPENWAMNQVLNETGQANDIPITHHRLSSDLRHRFRSVLE